MSTPETLGESINRQVEYGTMIAIPTHEIQIREDYSIRMGVNEQFTVIKFPDSAAVRVLTDNAVDYLERNLRRAGFDDVERRVFDAFAQLAEMVLTANRPAGFRALAEDEFVRKPNSERLEDSEVIRRFGQRARLFRMGEEFVVLTNGRNVTLHLIDIEGFYQLIDITTNSDEYRMFRALPDMAWPCHPADGRPVRRELINHFIEKRGVEKVYNDHKQYSDLLTQYLQAANERGESVYEAQSIFDKARLTRNVDHGGEPVLLPYGVENAYLRGMKAEETFAEHMQNAPDAKTRTDVERHLAAFGYKVGAKGLERDDRPTAFEPPTATEADVQRVLDQLIDTLMIATKSDGVCGTDFTLRGSDGQPKQVLFVAASGQNAALLKIMLKQAGISFQSVAEAQAAIDA